MADLLLRKMQADEWDLVARLIHDSTNAWYEGHGMAKIFAAGPESTRLFCEVYEGLDPGCCFVVVDTTRGELAGSCFFHPRATHVSLGIMNVHPDYFGRGVARRLLRAITDFADERRLPVRLVSSALNLDSFSLYNRGGFVPEAIYQDMLVDGSSKWADSVSRTATDAMRVRPASMEDLPAMIDLDLRLTGLDRARDLAMFIENQLGCWHISVAASAGGELHGFLASIKHPASCLVGPGVADTEDAAICLVAEELCQHVGGQALVLVPCTAPRLAEAIYAWGGRNCELHVAQVRGDSPPARGVVLPTFMPETG